MNANINIKFKGCCYGCVHRDTYLNEHTMNSDNQKIAVVTEIGCEHEKVCKEYREDNRGYICG
jgi:pheromone shutdown protein TraB